MTETRQPIITVTGPSGAGKTELVRALVREHGFAEITSTTTRAPRAGEREGVDYHFVTPERFAEIEAGGGFLEVIRFTGKAYGAEATEVERNMASGRPSLIVVEPNGADQVRAAAARRGWGCGAVFVDRPPLPVLIERHIERVLQSEPGAERERQIPAAAERLVSMLSIESTWRESMQWDHVISRSTNAEELDSAVRAVVALAQALRERPAPAPDTRPWFRAPHETLAAATREELVGQFAEALRAGGGHSRMREAVAGVVARAERLRADPEPVMG